MTEWTTGHRVIAGRYRLLSALGEGGMGTVWQAQDEMLHREVALKEIRVPAGLPQATIELLYARLEREAWAAARVSNRNVVTVFDVVTENGHPWIVMELIRGIALSSLLESQGPLPPQRAAQIGAEVLAALRAAHAAGVLHRDIKPANVLLANDGRVVLTDFGIAMVEGTSALTMTGEVIGSPEFLAPERALGQECGPAADLWSLGVLLYATVEGHSPFRQNTPLSTLRAVVDQELPSPRRAGALSPVIAGLLRKDPAERLTAAPAERLLWAVQAGGTARELEPRPGHIGAERDDGPDLADPAVEPSEAPTTVVHATGQPQPSSTDTPGGSHSTNSMIMEEESGRARSSAVLLIAGLIAIALALAGLTYALVNRDSAAHSGSSHQQCCTGGEQAGMPRDAR